jgi:hypothetical protein
MAEQGHADDGVDEGDERQECADVEERRQRDDQREQELPDAFGGFDEPQDSTDSGMTVPCFLSILNFSLFYGGE